MGDDPFAACSPLLGDSSPMIQPPGPAKPFRGPHDNPSHLNVNRTQVNGAPAGDLPWWAAPCPSSPRLNGPGPHERASGAQRQGPCEQACAQTHEQSRLLLKASWVPHREPTRCSASNFRGPLKGTSGGHFTSSSRLPESQPTFYCVPCPSLAALAHRPRSSRSE